MDGPYQEFTPFADNDFIGIVGAGGILVGAAVAFGIARQAMIPTLLALAIAAAVGFAQYLFISRLGLRVVVDRNEIRLLRHSYGLGGRSIRRTIAIDTVRSIDVVPLGNTLAERFANDALFHLTGSQVVRISIVGKVPVLVGSPDPARLAAAIQSVLDESRKRTAGKLAQSAAARVPQPASPDEAFH